MEMFRQILKNNQVDLGELIELNEIFNLLGNQQEEKNVFDKVKKYLVDLEGNCSVWKVDNSGTVESVWTKKKYEDVQHLEKVKQLLLLNKKNKKPIIEKEEGIYAIIPIVAREEVIGFLSIDEKIEDKEIWKKVYTTVQLLGFSFKYYEMIEMLKDLSIVDLMTGLYNHRHFRFQIGLEVDKANRFKKPLTLVFMKIKDFDEINKRLGFENGELVLKEFAKIIKKQVRSTDMPARINDETFAVLMYETEEAGARTFLKRMEGILKAKKVLVDGTQFNVEMETQIKEYRKNTSSEEFFESAKKAEKEY